MQTVFLSYSNAREVPVYGNSKAQVEIKPIKDMACGDSCRTFWFGMENHWGTHIDSPAHFFKNGKKLVDYPASFWSFTNSQVIGLPLNKGDLVSVGHLEGKVKNTTDLLILKTGFADLRGQEEYSKENPGVHSEVGIWLRKNYPNLRCIGFDFVSLSSFLNREEGRKAHKTFLDPEAHGNPILILEDMNLKNLSDISTFENIVIAPIMFDDLDSSPCTVIGFYDD